MENRREKWNRMRKDSSGFTLVELIITIAILAVVTIPLLSYFSDAARHNAENRRKQDAVVAAQDILEGLKTTKYSLDDESVVCAKDTEWSVKTPAINPGAAYVLKRDLSVDDKDFSVEAQITPVSTIDPTGMGVTTDTLTYEKAVIGSMDSSKDVLASDHGQTILSAGLYFAARHEDYCAANGVTSSVKAEDLESMLKCKIHVKAEDNPKTATLPADKKEVKFTVSYEYSFDTSNAFPDGDSSLGTVASYKDIVESTSICAKEVNNIFIFYNPLNSNDEVVFESDPADPVYNSIENGKIKVFLVAQNSVPFNSTVPAGYSERPNAYEIAFTCGQNSDGNYSNFHEKIGGIYCNLNASKNEQITGTNFISKIKKINGEYTMIEKQELNRLADIQVTIYFNGKEYVQVKGSKVQE